MSGLPGDENPNPQWQLPSQGQPQWQQGSPLGDQEAGQDEQQTEEPRWQQAPQPNPQWQPGPRTPGKAIAALILGIAAVFPFCPWVLAIPALICGYSAKREIDNSGGALVGRGLALTGIVLAWAAIAFWTLLVVAVSAL